MKSLKERSLWVLFAFMAIAGILLIVTLSLQRQLPVIPDVSAQDFDLLNLGSYDGYNLSTQVYGLSLQNLLYYRPGSVLFGMSPQNVLFLPSVARSGVAPQNVLFGAGASPHNVLFDEDGGSLTTLMTCSGCAQTMSTCDWYCGPTFVNCPSSSGSGSNTMAGCTSSMCSTRLNCNVQTRSDCPGPTGMLCPGPTGVDCLSYPTETACGPPSALYCPVPEFTRIISWPSLLTYGVMTYTPNANSPISSPPW